MSEPWEEAVAATPADESGPWTEVKAAAVAPWEEASPTSTATTPAPSLHESLTADLSSGQPERIAKAQQDIGNQAMDMFRTGVASGNLQNDQELEQKIIAAAQPPRSSEELAAQNLKLRQQFSGQIVPPQEGVQGLDFTGILPRPNGRLGSLLRTGTGPEKAIAGGIVAAEDLIEGVANYMSTDQGIRELGLSKTPVAPLVFLKWAKDMVQGAKINVEEAADAYYQKDWERFGKNVVAGFGQLVGAGMAGTQGLKSGSKAIMTRAVELTPRGTGISPEAAAIAPQTTQAAVESAKKTEVPNALVTETTQPVRGLRPRDEVQQVPTESGGATAGSGGSEALTAQTEAALKESQAVVQPENVTPGDVTTSVNAQPPSEPPPERPLASPEAGVTETLWSSSEPQPGKANYFSSRKEDADAYAQGRESKQHQVTVKNPFDPETSKDAELVALFDKLGGIYEAPQNAEFISALKSKGYDSVIGGEKGFGGESKWVVTYDKPSPGGGMSTKSAADQARQAEANRKMQEEFGAEVAAEPDLRSPTSAIKQTEPISEASPPHEKIDQSSEFAPPSSENPPAASDVGPGLGAAKLGEVAVQGNPDIYGVAERVREQRAAAGQVEPIEPGKGIAPADSVQRGRELIRSGRSAEQVMFNFEKTKQLSADDMAIARAHGEDLAERARRIEEEFGTDSPEYKTARDFLTEWDKRSKAMQTEWAKTGQAQQGETDIDTGSFTGLARAFKEQTGKDFTPKQEKIAKRKAGAKKKADAEAAVAKENLFRHLDESVDATTAEKRALAAAHKTVRENAVRVANAETELRVAKSEAETKAAQAKVELERKNQAAAEKIAREAATRLANAETRQRVKEANRPEALQNKAAKDALEAANKAKRDAATKLADEEAKQRQAQTKQERDIANVAVKRAQKAVKAADDAIKKAAVKAAQAETKLRIARADKSQFLWDKAREYIDQGMENFDDIRNRLAVDTGMSVDEVTAALGKTKQAKRLTNELWKKHQIARRLGQMAKQWLRDTTLPGYRRAIESVPKILFSLKVGFHGTVALGTHAPAVAFQPRFWKTYVQDFGKMYRMVGGPAYYEHQISDLVRRKNYITARRAGLVNDPVQYEDFNSPDTSKYLASLTTMGNRGYAILKILRQDMFDQHWDNLPRSLQQPEFAKAIADAVNHATGVVKVSPPKGTAVALFAPRLEMSRVSWLLVDPAIAMKTAIEWKTATRAEKYFAIQQLKEKAWVAGTLYGLLALNQGFLSATDSKQRVNGIPEFAGGSGFDPMKGDFMKFKVAGMQLSYGNAMLTMARLPVRLYEIRQSDGGKLKNLVHPDENTYTVLGEYARSQMSPFASLVSSLWFKADWQNRPLPSSNRPVPKRLQAQGVKPYTWPEFWTEQVLPIPFEEAAREVWHSGLGMSDAQIAQMRKAMATIAIMGATGARLSDDWTLNERPKPLNSGGIQPTPKK